MSISDTGCGISAHEQLSIFDPFHQVDQKATRHHPGTGLGLAITKRLVDLQNGKIEVESELGKGTKFTVFLPYKIATNEQVEQARVKAEEPNNYDDLQGNKILVVEDNRINQLVVAKMLRKLGMDVTTADNGMEALEAFNASYFDLVLMDIQMPVMDGLAATRAIRMHVSAE